MNKPDTSHVRLQKIFRNPQQVDDLPQQVISPPNYWGSSSPSYCNQLTRGTTFLAVQGPTCAQGEFAGTLDLDDYLVYVKLWKYGTRKDVSCKLKICPVYLLFEKVELRLAPSPELKILEKGRCRDLQPFFAHL